MIELTVAAILAGFAATGILATVAEVSSEEIPKMPKRDARVLLERSEIVAIDVRMPNDWEASDSKIREAVREDPQDIGSWAEKYPKDKALVLY